MPSTNMVLFSSSVIGENFQSVNGEFKYPDEMEWFERIIELRKQHGLSRAELSRLSDVSYDRLNKYERGEVDHPRGNVLKKLARALGTTELFLRYGAGEQAAPPERKLKTLSELGEVAAGLWFEPSLFEEERKIASSIPADARYPANAQFLLRVRGESLNKIARDGDLLWCVHYLESGMEPMNGDVAVIERSRDGGHTFERTAKRIVMANGKIELMPESTDPRFQDRIAYDDYGEEATEVIIKAKVIFSLRSL